MNTNSLRRRVDALSPHVVEPDPQYVLVIRFIEPVTMRVVKSMEVHVGAAVPALPGRDANGTP